MNRERRSVGLTDKIMMLGLYYFLNKEIFYDPQFGLKAYVDGQYVVFATNGFPSTNYSSFFTC